MNNRINGVTLAIGLSIAALIVSSYAIIISLYSKKYAYVRSKDLITGYVGVKEAKNVFQSKSQSWNANVDTLKLSFQKAVAEYNLASIKMNSVEKRKQEDNLRMQQQNLIEYERIMKEKAREEDEKITSGLLNQINSYVEEYGKKHGYDIIFGTSTDGNLMFGKNDMDITDDVLNGLNESYLKGSTKEN